MKPLATAILLLLLWAGTGRQRASAQDFPFIVFYSSSLSRSYPVPQGDFDRLTIPIKRAGNLLLVEATVDGVTGNFILDTGAPKLVLNKTYFRQGKTLDGSSLGITGGESPVSRQRVDSLLIEELFYTSVFADVVNLGHIEDAKGLKLLGLLGTNLFTQLAMEIDVENDVIYLERAGAKATQPASGSASGQPDVVLNFDVLNDIIFLEGTVANKKLRFCLDTGAESNVLSNTVGNKVLDQFRLMSRTSLGGSGTPQLSVLSGQLEELYLGGHNFRRMPTILTSLSSLQEVYSSSLDGILGYYFLANGRVVINFPLQQIEMYFYNEGQ